MWLRYFLVTSKICRNKLGIFRNAGDRFEKPSLPTPKVHAIILVTGGLGREGAATSVLVMNRLAGSRNMHFERGIDIDGA
jgi:hypothetical protein